MSQHNYAGVTPAGGDAHFDVPLGNMAVSAFSDGVDDLIGNEIFSAVPVGKESDKYYVIDKDAFLRNDDALRAPKTQARRIEFEVSSNAYMALNYAFANEEPLENLANADNPIQMRENSVRLITGKLLRAQEIRIADLLTCADNLGSGAALTGTAKWNDYVNSTPLSDINTAHAFIRQQTGLVANTAVVDYDTLKVLQRHPDILDMYKYTQGGMATGAEIKAVFEVDRLLVGKGVKQNALEGNTSSSVTNIWGNNVVLAHTQPGVSMQTMTLGLRFQWTPAGMPAAFGVTRAREDGAGSRHVEIIESGHYQDEKIVAADLGYAITGTL
jgi:hypothetical protein